MLGVGEQYVNMISDWQTVNTQDNDVHELFKFMCESMLTNAFVIERADGSVKGYNCSVVKKKNSLDIIVDENQMTNIHCNLKKAYTITFKGKKKDLPNNYMGWAFGKDIYIDKF